VRGALKNYYVPSEDILNLPSVRKLLASELA
jgi:hypothetical protein